MMLNVKESSGLSGKISIDATAGQEIKHSNRDPAQSIHEWIIILLCLTGAVVYESEMFEPNQQEIPGSGEMAEMPHYLSYPRIPATISTSCLVLYSGLPCIVLFILNGIILKYYDSNFQLIKFMHYFHLMVRSMSFAFSATWFASNIMKYSIGRPRPNYGESYQSKPIDSILSYPSTHTSVSFALLFQLTLYLYCVHSQVMTDQAMAKRTSYDPWNAQTPYAYYGYCLFYKLRRVPLLSLIITGIPTYFATYIACSRLTDYHHFYSDVNAGVMIGSFFAMASFHHFSQYLHCEQLYIRSLLSESESIKSEEVVIKVNEGTEHSH
eukprot:502027_1